MIVVIDAGNLKEQSKYSKWRKNEIIIIFDVLKY